MTITPVPERSRSSLNKQTEEPDIQANTTEAARLYQRGVAAARGGQRRVAAGFLTRSVQLNPRNEGAWLWLSGVLDEPREIEFCLKSVLKLNPHNERAQRGLRWLQERDLLRGAPTINSPLLEVEVDESLSQRVVRTYSESWWVNWRQWRRDARRATLAWWALPVLVLMLALIIHRSFAIAVEESNKAPVLPTLIALVAAHPPAALVPHVEPTPAPVFEAMPLSVRESQTVAYLQAIEPLRQSLREAVNTYRESTVRPGDSVNHVAAAQSFRSSVERSYTTMQEVSPPADLQFAHDEYLKGLEKELLGIDSLLEFYSSYRIEQANRAALSFQEANAYFGRARTLFQARIQEIGQVNGIAEYTAR